ncbi:MAG TPA: nucleosidase [Mycobacteriales bacterium]|nr:nucleosidase [Mycobacteriales bacterium]
MTRSDVLVVAATREEARYVPEGLPVLVTGLGKVAAAASVAGWLGAATPLEPGFEVINIGTAGALRDGVSGLHLPGRVINHDISADLLAGMGVRVEDSLDLHGGSDIVLATGDSFIADPVTRDALAERAALVDMEAFAVVWACRKAAVRVRVVKHVSDNADTAALSWPELVDGSAKALGDWLVSYLA